MSQDTLKLAVVGHTNAGKTSLLRTLLRDVEFGEVSDHPGTTRHVTSRTIPIDQTRSITIIDTPGLEDSIALLESLDARRSQRDDDPIVAIESFLEATDNNSPFAHEADVLRTVLDCDVVLYVIDAREPVLAKYRDELRILSYTARPVVPVLNFTAQPDAQTRAWRDQLARLALHATAEFDTVVLDPHSEERLWEKIRSLADQSREILDAVLEQRKRERRTLLRASARAIAELLVDVAACRVITRTSDKSAAEQVAEAMRQRVREREQSCIHTLLQIHRFRETDILARPIPVENGTWNQDLFDPESLREFGIKGGGGAAAGAMLGFTIDLMVGGLSLGAATLVGAAAGALMGASHRPAQDLLRKWTGRVCMRINAPTLHLLLARQMSLVNQLMRRGHAATQPSSISGTAASDQPTAPALAEVDRALKRAARHAEWSRLNEDTTWSDPMGRNRCIAELTERIELALIESERHSTPRA